MATRAAAEDAPLTHRQQQVVAMLADGYSNREIAEALDISFDGAKWHVGEILLKLNVDSREEAAAWWLTREQRAARRPSRSFWAVALAVPWKLAAALAGVFGGSSGLRPHVQTDEAALLRDTAVTATWEPPPPPSIVSTANQQASDSGPGDNGRHEFVVPESPTSVERPEANTRPDDPG
jgi:DNA-binding CsgD family transcriptional regulator